MNEQIAELWTPFTGADVQPQVSFYVEGTPTAKGSKTPLPIGGRITGADVGGRPQFRRFFRLADGGPNTNSRKKYTAWEHAVIESAEQFADDHGLSVIDTMCFVAIDFWIAGSKSTPKYKRVEGMPWVGAFDVDKMVRQVLDCLQKAMVLKNDNLVVAIFTRKLATWTGDTGAQIRITHL